MTAPLPFTDLGPCAFCGHPDAGHRVRDGIRDYVAAGDPIESVAVDFDLTVEQVHDLIDWPEPDWPVDDREAVCSECDDTGFVRDITARTEDGAVAEVGPARRCSSCEAEPT